MPPKKRPFASVKSSSPSSSSKYPKSAKAITVGASRSNIVADSVSSAQQATNDIKTQFLTLLSSSQYKNGISNTQLKQTFGEEKYKKLVPIINELMKDARLNLSRQGNNELIYNMVDFDMSEKFYGLDMQHKLVYQVIEKAGDKGIWTRDIRTQTNIQQQAITKIFKLLEGRKLIKPVKAVTNKSKKLYILYNLKPSKEITGGPWYTESEFDHEFISELRNFILMCIRRMNSAKGVSLSDVVEKMKQAAVSKVELDQEEVSQLLQTLAFDYMIEQNGVNAKGEPVFVETKRVSPMSDFKWWDEVLSGNDEDFGFRKIMFEDGVSLSAHEFHHQSS